MRYKYSAIAGLDLSYSGTGFVISSEREKPTLHLFRAGKPNESFYARARSLWGQMSPYITSPKETLIAIEGAAFGKPFRAFQLGELAGAIKYLLADMGVEMILVAPTSLKKFATGMGNADKAYMNSNNKWGFHNSDNNIVDAFCLYKYAENYIGVEVEKELEAVGAKEIALSGSRKEPGVSPPPTKTREKKKPPQKVKLGKRADIIL